MNVGSVNFDKRFVQSTEAASVRTDGGTQVTAAESERPADGYSHVEKADARTYKPDTATIERLQAEVNARTESLRSLVQKMIAKQAGTATLADANNFWDALKSGNYTVDAATRAEAQKNIADDGYWGVEQTSDRIVKYATALSGGDPEKLDTMIAAFEKGYEAAAKAFGGTLPDICSKTREAVHSKFEELRKQYASGTEE